MSTTTKTQTWKVVFDADAGKFVTQLSKAERTTSQKFSQMSKSVGKMSASITRNFTVPFLGFLGAATKMKMDFDQTLLRMVTLAGKTSEEVAAMRPQIIKTASQYGKSAKEAADAMYFIASSGVEGSKAMDILDQSLMMSAAGMGDTQVLADLLTSAMNAYGSDVLSAADATDYLIGAIREGKADPTELAGAMSRVLPIASNMGVQFGEVSAAFAALSTGGTDASEAATQLRGVLASILKPSAKAEKTLKNMGMSSEGLRKLLKEKGLLALLGKLRTEFKGNSSQIADVFGNMRALTGVLDLTGVKWKKSVDIFNKVDASKGAGQEIKTLLENDPGQKFKVSIENLKNQMITFGDEVAPELDKVTKALEKLTKGLENMDPGTRSFIVNIGLAVAIMAPIVWTISKIVSLVEKFNKAVAKFPNVSKFLGKGGKFLGKLALPASTFLGAYELADALLPKPQRQIQNMPIPTTTDTMLLQLEELRKYNPEAAARLEARMRAEGKIKAIGGTVSAGSTYLVGERGPELFSPTSNGYITANNRLGGGAQGVNVVVNVHGSVIRERDLAVSVRDQIAQLMRRRGLDPSILGV